MELKKAKVVLIPTEEKPTVGTILLRHIWKNNPKLECRSIWQYKATENIGGLDQYTTLNGSFRDVISSFAPQHAHVVVGYQVEKLKVGDWYLSETYPGTKNPYEGQRPEQLLEEDLPLYEKYKETTYKIIASTDKKVTDAEPSKAFIGVYCNAGGIEDVMVEYDVAGHHEIPVEMWTTLKVDKHNTITIRQVKTNYTREEVEVLLEDFREEAWQHGLTKQILEKFKLKNL